MPLRLQQIFTAENEAEIMTDLIMYTTCDKEAPEKAYVSDDRYLHAAYNLYDQNSRSPFGQIVHTMKIDNEENVIRLIDLDVILNCESSVKLEFLDRRKASTDANEYYEVMTEDGAHLLVETVFRHAVKEELLGSSRAVKVSAFPFRLTVFENIEEFDREYGFDREIKVRGTEFVVHGFSETFTMPGGSLAGDKDEENYTFMLGKVRSERDITWNIGKTICRFRIVELETAAGLIPVMMSEDYFDLEKLKEGAIVAMNADLKANLMP